MIASLVLSVYFAINPIDIEYVEKTSSIYLASVVYQIPTPYLFRLVEKESKGDRFVVSYNKNGTIDLGLLQHNSKYYDYFKWRYNKGIDYDPFNIQDNLRIGCKHLKTLYKHTGTWEGTFVAWNCGLTRYRSGDIPTTSMELMRFVIGEPLWVLRHGLL
jgi:soluble lytic murein transglycosylase-like protein